MRGLLFWMAGICSFAATNAFACDTPICQVDPGTLILTQTITFDDLPSGWDPGHLIDDILVQDGARFAERFAGQSLEANGDFDVVVGSALPPLTLLPGASGQTMAVVNLNRNNILNGFGPAGFPRPHAQGEGAIAVMFDTDQPALAFEVLGGEAGMVRVQFLRRDGTVIHDIKIATDGTLNLGFFRQDALADIAGFVMTNMDPQGLAIDNVRFGPPPQMG